MQWMFEGLIILAMLAVNAIFAAYEMALASVSSTRLVALAQRNRRGAQAAVHMKGRLEKSLAVVQVGITLAAAIAAATGGVGVDEYLAPSLSARLGLSASAGEMLAVALFIIPLSTLTIIFAELVPKMFALRNSEAVALFLSPAMKVISHLSYPAIFVLESTVKWVMRANARPPAGPAAEGEEGGFLELRAAAALARASRLIGALEEKIVVSAAQLSVREVREVMLPADEIAMIPETATLAEALIAAHAHMHTRYPTCTEADNPQTISGYLNFKDIVAALRIHPADPSLRNILRPIRRIDAHTSLALALEQMMRESVHIALVTGAGGVVSGLVTLEDIVEELVGAIGDEYDRLPSHLHPLARGWLAGGGAPMPAVRQATGTVPGSGPAEGGTLAAWCAARHSGELGNDTVIRADGLEVRVRKTRRRKVTEAVLAVAPAPPPPAA